MTAAEVAASLARMRALVADLADVLTIERAMGDPVAEEMARQTRDRLTRRQVTR